VGLNKMRYVLKVQYNGTAFHGSQLQGDLPTVQLALNTAISTLLREAIETYGASRTDEGVHANANFYHFDFADALPETFCYNLNAILPHSISVKNIYKAADDFNVRFDAISRTYRYKIYSTKNPFYYKMALFYPLKINEDILHQTAKTIQQYKDFESFCKRNAQNYTFLCNIYESYWEHIDDQLHYVVKANRFLRGMVRALVGTQLKAAKGKITVDDFIKIIEAKDCTLADFSVAGHGLYLE